jgi:uncharacterized membrane protein YdbT with pleckstrin-like domain
MNQEHAEFFELCKDLFLFSDLDERQLYEVVSRFEPFNLEEGQVLLNKGDKGDYFYIILDGKIKIKRIVGRDNEETDILISGDFLGEEALLYNNTQESTATSEEFTRLMRLDRENFHHLQTDYPSVKQNLIRTAETRKIIRTRKFNWLGEDEVVYQIARKHEAILVVNLIGPFLFGLVSVLIMFFAAKEATDSFLWIAGVFFSSLMALAGLAWGIWSWIDWGNDYYIVTDQRVVWIEKVIGLYDSLDEAPLNTILSVNVTTNQLGRILGFGNVIVRTFTGQITFRNVGQPNQIAAAVEEYWHRAQKISERVEREALEEAIQQRLGLIEGEEIEEPEEISEELGPPPPLPPPKKRSLWERLFSNFLKMRFEEGNVITYRKYWPVFINKTWLPSLIFVLIFTSSAYLLAAYYFGQIHNPPPLTVISISAIVVVGILVPWWIYQYVDWRNDIYQVTDKYILDIERRPLGTQVKKSAPLENILSLENRRVGFLGYLLNYGNVTINVGEAKFIFLNIYNPARAQQDIFNRMYQLRQKQEMAEQEQERERLADALTMYHRNVEEYRKIERSWESDQEYSVE